MSPNSEMQLIKTCENCKKVKDLEAEIVKLYEHVTELEAVIYDLENQIVERKQELYVIF